MEILADDHPKNGITEKLEPLVSAPAIILMGIGDVGEREIQQSAIGKFVKSS